MPNKLRRNKRRSTRISATGVSKPPRAADSVKAVLGRAAPALTRLAAQASRQNYWKTWLAEHLPGELTARLSGVVEREHTLVIFAESAAWSTRLRYALQELEAPIKQARPNIQHVSVRVLPRA